MFAGKDVWVESKENLRTWLMFSLAAGSQCVANMVVRCSELMRANFTSYPQTKMAEMKEREG